MKTRGFPDIPRQHRGDDEVDRSICIQYCFRTGTAASQYSCSEGTSEDSRVCLVWDLFKGYIVVCAAQGEPLMEHASLDPRVKQLHSLAIRVNPNLLVFLPGQTEHLKIRDEPMQNKRMR